MNPALELAEYLEAQGIGVFGGDTDFSLHTVRQPISPDRVVTLYDTNGATPIVIDTDDEGDDASLYAPSLQIRVRSPEWEDAYERHVLIRDALILPTERIIGDHRYVSIVPTSDIIDAGLDENERYELTANYDITRHPIEEAT